jgi:hypothetical protein
LIDPKDGGTKMLENSVIIQLLYCIVLYCIVLYCIVLYVGRRDITSQKTNLHHYKYERILRHSQNSVRLSALWIHLSIPKHTYGGAADLYVMHRVRNPPRRFSLREGCVHFCEGNISALSSNRSKWLFCSQILFLPFLTF